MKKGKKDFRFCECNKKKCNMKADRKGFDKRK
jgi:hypothetical protein